MVKLAVLSLYQILIVFHQLDHIYSILVQNLWYKYLNRYHTSKGVSAFGKVMVTMATDMSNVFFSLFIKYSTVTLLFIKYLILEIYCIKFFYLLL